MTVMAVLPEVDAMKTVISWALSAVVAYFTGVDFFVISSTVSAGMDIYTSWITRPKLGQTDDKNALHQSTDDTSELGRGRNSCPK